MDGDSIEALVYHNATRVSPCPVSRGCKLITQLLVRLWLVHLALN